MIALLAKVVRVSVHTWAITEAIWEPDRSGRMAARAGARQLVRRAPKGLLSWTIFQLSTVAKLTQAR